MFVVLEWRAMPSYDLIYDVEVFHHLAVIERKYHPLIRETMEQQLQHEPLVETRNRKPLRSPTESGADWELRLGPNNRFRVLYRTDEASNQIIVLAIGVKDGNRLLIGGEEIDL
jgi:hypothetical protein